ncbi:hypothetical protein ABID56_001561 [Alkalibacillus flavidus]|uniref:DUF4181 domain-containing protein n=1 Tax=Alkalibacillus flavidus TaxID=546021 RepID=A0ABV2KV51_9BACI
MKKYWKAIENYFEDVDKRMDNNLTLAGALLVFAGPAIFDQSFYDAMILVTLVLLIRLGWDLINPNSREQKRYRQTISIAVDLGSYIFILWIIFKILFPYP